MVNVLHLNYLQCGIEFLTMVMKETKKIERPVIHYFPNKVLKACLNK